MDRAVPDLGRHSRIAAAASAWAIVIGALTLLGYALDIRVLVRGASGHGVLQVPDAALAFVVAGTALWLVAPTSAPIIAAAVRRRRAGQLLGLLVALFGAVVLTQYVTSRDVNVDLILFPGQLRAWATNDIPGRPSPYTAVAFVVTGLSLALLDADAGHRYRPARALVPATALIVLVIMIGYASGVSYLRHGTPHVAGIGLNSAVTFVVLTVGILACRPDRPLAHFFAGRGPGGAARWRLVPVLTAILLLAVLVAAIGRSTLAAAEALALTASAAAVLVTLYLVFLRAEAALDLSGRALRYERDFSQTVLRSLREGVITFGPDGAVLQVNLAWCEITGLSAQEAIGLKPPYPWWPAEQVPDRMAGLAAIAAAESSTESDIIIRRPDGTEVEVAATAVPVRSNGVLRMIVGTCRDLTERNRAEAKVQRAAHQLDHFFDLSVDLMCVAGIDGYFKRLNPAWEKTLGYPISELLARPFVEFTHPDDVDRTSTESAAQARDGKISTSFENRYRCSDGSYRWLSWNATPDQDSGTIYAVARDTTDQRLADQARSLLAAIVDSTDDATVGMTLDGTIISWNSAAESNYGYRADEAIGQSIHLITGVGGPGEMREILDRVASGMPVTHHKTVRMHKDGNQLHVEVTISPIRDAAGTIVGAASVARDIGARLQFEQALATARDEALAAAQLKSQFVATVSHEIRTPMNGVIGLTGLLLETPLQPGQRRYAEAIRTSGRALLTIVNDILDFSKIEAGKIELANADFDLGKLLESVARVAAEAGRGKDLEIAGYYPPGLRTAVRGDEGRLRQILLNLLGNAVKFTQHGEVLLRATPAGSAADGRPQVTFAISDTGIGIATADLPLLFKPFSQLDAAADRQFGGTGLGLTIARELIELMGGQLEVRSQPGQGSQFTFTVPLASPPRPTAEPAAASTWLAARRVLIVVGNPAARRLLSEHGSAWGMRPTAVADGRTVVGLLHAAADQGQPYDAAVIDQYMPGRDGADLTQQIIADPVIATTKLILLTSGSYHDDEAAAAVGAAVMPKPVSPSQMYNCLLDLLDPTSEAALQAQPSATRHRDGDMGMILLAEDNEINQMVAADNLGILGYGVDIARNGIEAVQLATTKPYLAILMDCQMPKMDGYTATAQLRRRERPDQHVPIIAMTAGALAEDKARCLAAGMDDYLAKPIDPEQLRTALWRWTTQPAAPPTLFTPVTVTHAGD